jgi:hypothetical protein
VDSFLEWSFLVVPWLKVGAVFELTALVSRFRTVSARLEIPYKIPYVARFSTVPGNVNVYFLPHLTAITLPRLRNFKRSTGKRSQHRENR